LCGPAPSGVEVARAVKVAVPVVNRAVVNDIPAVNSAVNKRGKYPGTEKRREYMRGYMKRWRVK
jgi:hypothetical protein